MKAYLEDQNVCLEFKYDARVVNGIRALPVRTFDARGKRWLIPLSEAKALQPLLAIWGFSLDPFLERAFKSFESDATELEGLAIQPDAPFVSTLPLLPYQKVGAAYLARLGSGLLGDDVGLGKTIQALAVVEADKSARSVLIFCPAILKYQWQSEIEKFTHREAVVIDGNPEQRKIKWDTGRKWKMYTIANYELLLRDFDQMAASQWDYIIADEATKIASPRSKQGKLIKKLRATHRLALTGTPISNRPDELWNVLDFCNPGCLGSFWGFLQRYCVKNKWGAIEGYQNEEELRVRIKRYMIRRMKADVLPELPPKIVTDVPFQLTAKEQGLYERLRMEILFEIEKPLIAKINDPFMIQNTLSKMTRLRQLADSMELLGEDTTSSKLEALRSILEACQGQKVIIFTEFSQMADILEREYLGLAYKITGETSAQRRTEIVEIFNGDNPPGYPVRKKILIMTSAGQFGLNIQAASVIIHYDQPWSIAKVVQREGRAHRMGQKQTVLVYNLIAQNTLDEFIQKKLRGKQAVADKILGQDVLDALNFGK